MAKFIHLYIDTEDIPIFQKILEDFVDDFQCFKSDEDVNTNSMPKDRNPILIDFPNLIQDFTSDKSLLLFQKWWNLCRSQDYHLFHKQMWEIWRDEIVWSTTKVFYLTFQSPLGNTIPMSSIYWLGNQWWVMKPASKETEYLWQTLKKHIAKNSTLFSNKNGWKVYAFPHAMKKINAWHPYGDDTTTFCAI